MQRERREEVKAEWQKNVEKSVSKGASMPRGGVQALFHLRGFFPGLLSQNPISELI